MKQWATASGAAAGSQYATYADEATEATVWESPKGNADLNQAFTGYQKVAGIKAGTPAAFPPGARGGTYECAAVNANQTICFWSTEGLRGGADVTGLNRTEAAQLVARMRVGLEPAPPVTP
jgi:hypothetical protein